jgi:hypothetical protein
VYGSDLVLMDNEDEMDVEDGEDDGLVIVDLDEPI